MVKLIERYLIEFADTEVLQQRLVPYMAVTEDDTFIAFRLQVDHLWHPDNFAPDMHVIVTLAGASYTDGFGKARQGKPKGVIRGRYLRTVTMRGSADKLLVCKAEFILREEPEKWAENQKVMINGDGSQIEDVGPLLTVTGQKQTPEVTVQWEMEYGDED